MSTVSALVRACHPEPTVAVTVLSTVLFASAGNSAATCVLGAAAILTGQLSIGWSNDLIDARRDVSAGRTDKPVAAGDLTPNLLRRACAVAVVATVIASLALGWRPGLIHLAAVAAGWAYNLGLKSNPASPLPYVCAFAALPMIATNALNPPHWPPPLVIVAAGLIGAAAHFGNVLPDLADDIAAGVRGLPQRLGPSTTSAAAVVLALAATVAAAVQPSSSSAVLRTVAVVVVAAILAGGVRLSRRSGRGDQLFYATMACAAIGVALIAAGGSLR